MGNTRYLFRYKIGISKDVNARKRNIDESLKGEVYLIFYARFFYARQVEALMHLVYRPFNARMKGSGKTEWFWLILPVTPVILLGLIWLIQRLAIIGLFFIVFWLMGYLP